MKKNEKNLKLYRDLVQGTSIFASLTSILIVISNRMETIFDHNVTEQELRRFGGRDYFEKAK